MYVLYLSMTLNVLRMVTALIYKIVCIMKQWEDPTVKLLPLSFFFLLIWPVKTLQRSTLFHPTFSRSVDKESEIKTQQNLKQTLRFRKHHDEKTALYQLRLRAGMGDNFRDR